MKHKKLKNTYIYLNIKYMYYMHVEIGFKKVLGCTYGAWGLGCDHQLYVYVEQTDVPIRIQESTYENEVRAFLSFEVSVNKWLFLICIMINELI